jgi:predicted metal-dependent phosphoesterase TrpH
MKKHVCHRLATKEALHINLHIHTTASDGALTPSEVVLSAEANGVDVISITDHDTVDGVIQALPAARKKDVCFIPGVELSADYHCEIHLLGYGIDPFHHELQSALSLLRQRRSQRTDRILERLCQSGIGITADDIRRHVPPSASEGRPHIAAALVDKGYASNISDAFVRFLSKGCCAYVPKERFSIQHCIELIDLAGGKSVLAHPKDTGLSDWLLEPLLKEMMGYGLWGLEVFHPSQKGHEHRFLSLAGRLGLSVTAGSDQHSKEPLTGYLCRPEDPLWSAADFLSRI